MAERQPRHCIDRVVPDSYQPARAELRRSLTPPKKGKFDPAFASGLPSSAGRGVTVPPRSSMRLALLKVKMWENGRTLKCRFLNGSNVQIGKVQAHARTWEQYANIKLKFVASTEAEIRISFAADPGSWSAVGTDALVREYFPLHQPTMNFGWLRDDTSDAECRRVVLHEFGHALGAIHEHAQPTSPLQWNKAAIYNLYSGPPNFWSKAEIDRNIISRYQSSQTNYSKFDPASIMLYRFDSGLLIGGKGTGLNSELSEQDKQFIAEMYSSQTAKKNNFT